MPFALNPAAAVEGMIDFDNQPNLKLHIREKTKLKDKLYNCVPHDMFNFLESLNN